MSTPEQRPTWDPHVAIAAVARDHARRNWLRSLPAGAQLGMPRLSVGIEPNRNNELEPADPRMKGWRQYDRRRAVTPGRYRAEDVIDDVEDWGDDAPTEPKILVWENPVTGEVRRCEAAPLAPWTDPWAADNVRILAEIQRRICTCGAPMPWGINDCICRHPITGWTYSDAFWTENIKPVPKRHRTLPAQYPMGTRWGRLRSWWWHATHRRPEPVPAVTPDFDDDEDW